VRAADRRSVLVTAGVSTSSGAVADREGRSR
jgi:hypothetical protein